MNFIVLSKRVLSYIVYFFIFLSGITSCDWSRYNPSQGMKPVYLTNIDIQKIETLPPKVLTEASKIYYKDRFIFAIEQGQGVHIIDNRDSLNPQKVRFIRIGGCNDIAIKGTVMYADNFTDLIAIDFRNIDSLKVLERIPNLYSLQNGTREFPINYHGYFECVDSTKGKVIGWKESVLENPQCRR